jgi:hypothetical protein
MNKSEQRKIEYYKKLNKTSFGKLINNTFGNVLNIAAEGHSLRNFMKKHYKEIYGAGEYDEALQARSDFRDRTFSDEVVPPHAIQRIQHPFQFRNNVTDWTARKQEELIAAGVQDSVRQLKRYHLYVAEDTVEQVCSGFIENKQKSGMLFRAPAGYGKSTIWEYFGYMAAQRSPLSDEHLVLWLYHPSVSNISLNQSNESIRKNIRERHFCWMESWALDTSRTYVGTEHEANDAMEAAFSYNDHQDIHHGFPMRERFVLICDEFYSAQHNAHGGRNPSQNGILRQFEALKGRLEGQGGAQMNIILTYAEEDHANLISDLRASGMINTQFNGRFQQVSAKPYTRHDIYEIIDHSLETWMTSRGLTNFRIPDRSRVVNAIVDKAYQCLNIFLKTSDPKQLREKHDVVGVPRLVSRLMWPEIISMAEQRKADIDKLRGLIVNNNQVKSVKKDIEDQIVKETRKLEREQGVSNPRSENQNQGSTTKVTTRPSEVGGIEIEEEPVQISEEEQSNQQSDAGNEIEFDSAMLTSLRAKLEEYNETDEKQTHDIEILKARFVRKYPDFVDKDINSADTIHAEDVEMVPNEEIVQSLIEDAASMERAKIELRERIKKLTGQIDQMIAKLDDNDLDGEDPSVFQAKLEALIYDKNTSVIRLIGMEQQYSDDEIQQSIRNIPRHEGNPIAEYKSKSGRRGQNEFARQLERVQSRALQGESPVPGGESPSSEVPPPPPPPKPSSRRL